MISKPSEERQDNWTEPGLGIRYHIIQQLHEHIYLGSDPGSIQQKMHWLGTEQEHRKSTRHYALDKALEKSLVRINSRNRPSF
jgi:hypothetical protein